VAAIAVYSAPDYGRKGRPKHVEHSVVFNKHNTARVASCWFIIYYILYNRRTFRNCMTSHITIEILCFILVLRADGMFHCYVFYACPAPRQFFVQE